MRQLCSALLVLALSACASSPRAGSVGHSVLSPLLRADWRPAPEQSCMLLPVPEWLSDATVLVDAAIAEQVLASSEAKARPAYAVLEVLLNSDEASTFGIRTRAAVVESNLPLLAQGMLIETVQP